MTAAPDGGEKSFAENGVRPVADAPASQTGQFTEADPVVCGGRFSERRPIQQNGKRHAMK